MDINFGSGSGSLTFHPNRFLSFNVKVTLWLALCVLLVEQSSQLLQEARTEYAIRNASSLAELNPAVRENAFSAGLANKRGDTWRQMGTPQANEWALAEFRQAVSLDPNDSDHWLHLGQICQEMNRIQEAAKAFAVIDALDPENDIIQQAIGNFLLAQGEMDNALRHHARAIHLNPGLARNIYSLYWSLGHSPVETAQSLLGANPDPNLVKRYWLDALASCEPDETGPLWEYFCKAPGLLDETAYQTYFNYLVSKKRFDLARDLWELIAHEFYQTAWDERKEPFWNGDFGHPCNFDGGLEWQTPRMGPAGVQWTFGEKFAVGTPRALRVIFDGTKNISFYGIRHGFFVVPGKTYRLGFHVKTLDITTHNGPYVRLSLTGEKPIWKNSPVVTETGEWDQSLEFTAPAGGGWGEINICRDQSTKFNNKIKGEVYYQDFTLEEKTP